MVETYGHFFVDHVGPYAFADFFAKHLPLVLGFVKHG